MLENKNILIGITGGIAAYKICTLIRLFKKSGANVRVVLTPNALNFVTKLTLQTLSNNEVYVDNFDVDNFKPEHISLCDEADICVVAPATANTISKIANGICDNLLTSTVCAFSKPILLAPAMNTNMWKNSFVQENMEKLKKAGYHIVDPGIGFLACGTSGEGRMAEVEDIYDSVVKIFSEGQKLKGKRILITAGGTKEKIDPVRYISNCSSGKMGLALADTAYNMGAEVTLISTFKSDKPYKNIVTETALEMEKAVKENLQNQNCVIMAAAVADYRVKEPAKEKMKKGENDSLTLELVKNPDILQGIPKGQFITVGFCAESENLLENAKEKIQKKGCDFLAANDISRNDIGFSSDMNEVYLLDKNLNITHFERNTKQNIAKQILEKVFEQV